MENCALVECTWLKEQITNGKTKSDGSLKVLDCNFKGDPKPDPIEFEKEYYGNIEKLIQRPSLYRDEYNAEHIEDAILFDLQAAMFPGKLMRLEPCPPELFYQYTNLLGLNQQDHIVLYDRSAVGGMVFACKAFWILKMHGFSKVSVLNGGFHEWKKLGFPTTQIIPKYPAAKSENLYDSNKLVKFEELFGPSGIFVKKEQDKVNLLDVRPLINFTGAEKQSVLKDTEGSRIPGFLNIPGGQFLKDGKMKSQEEIKELLKSCTNFDLAKPTIAMCTTGTKASLAFFSLTYINQSVSMFNGSLTEVANRAPELISAQGPIE